MDRVLRAHSLNEVRYFLRVQPCEDCGKGPWEAAGGPVSAAGGGAVNVTAQCRTCHGEREFEFTCEDPSIGAADGDERINPTSQPSHIVDLGQWLSLYDLMLVEAEAAASPFEAHRAACRAALCLEEALKFYEDDDELPPEGALFSHASDLAYHEHPEAFAQQHLRDLLIKLPSPHTVAPATVERAPSISHHKWWQFWKNHEEGR